MNPWVMKKLASEACPACKRSKLNCRRLNACFRAAGFRSRAQVSVSDDYVNQVQNYMSQLGLTLPDEEVKDRVRSVFEREMQSALPGAPSPETYFSPASIAEEISIM